MHEYFFLHLHNISYPTLNNDLLVTTSVNDQEMPQSHANTFHQKTGTLEHRQIRDTQISKAFSEIIAKLEMTQYKRLTRSAKHEPQQIQQNSK